MNKLIVIGVLMNSFLLSLPSYAKTDYLYLSCENTINNIKLEIENLGGELRFVQRLKLEGSYLNNPFNKTEYMGMTLGGYENNADYIADNIINSPVLLASLLKKIINDCDNIALVDWGIEQTDVGDYYGEINGEVSRFSCVAPLGSSQKLEWGEDYCAQ